jgi:NDP-sugar pyrophosphorylase family protein
VAGLREIGAGAWAEGPVFVGPNVRLIGPILFASNVAVASGSTLIGPVVIGSNSYIGKDALVRESVLWRHNVVGDGARLYRCIMGQMAAMPEGASAEGALIVDNVLSLSEAGALGHAAYRLSDLPPRPRSIPGLPASSLGREA